MADIFNIDFKKLVANNLPHVLRGTVWQTWLNASTTPLNTLNGNFAVFRNTVLYGLGINSQIPFLEKALNDKYDFTNRRIYISDPVRKTLTFIYRKAESKPVWLYKKSENKFLYFFTKAETSRLGVDFIINVPLAVRFDNAEMRAFVSKYKLASKRFKISVI